MKKALWVLTAILLVAGTNAVKGAGPDTQWLGVLWTKGAVSVGNAKVSSGTTVLPGDVITTSPGASAWIRFRSPASTILMADTEVTLLASNSVPSFLLRRGTVVVDENAVDPVQVAVPGGFVLVKGDPQSGAECEMASLDNGAKVSVKRGLAEIHGPGCSGNSAPGTIGACRGQSGRWPTGSGKSQQGYSSGTNPTGRATAGTALAAKSGD